MRRHRSFPVCRGDRLMARRIRRNRRRRQRRNQHSNYQERQDPESHDITLAQSAHQPRPHWHKKPGMMIEITLVHSGPLRFSQVQGDRGE